MSSSSSSLPLSPPPLSYTSAYGTTDRLSRYDHKYNPAGLLIKSSIVPQHYPEVEDDGDGILEFPPGDARAMSPRRAPEDIDKLSKDAKETLQQQSRRLQIVLQSLSERIDEIQRRNQKLEDENQYLLCYADDLSRRVSSKNDKKASCE